MENSYSNKEINYTKALSKAMYWCSQKEMCEYEVIAKLEKLQLNTKDIKLIVSKLIDDKFIDELRYVRAYVKDKMYLNKWGVNKIKNMLISKKISKETIQIVFLEINSDDYREKAYELAKKKYLSIKKGDKKTKVYKTINFLLYRGYEYSLIIELIKLIDKDIEDEHLT